MFVNPYSCSCTTCHDYVSAEKEWRRQVEQEEQEPSLPPAPPASLTSLERRLALGRRLGIAPAAPAAPVAPVAPPAPTEDSVMQTLRDFSDALRKRQDVIYSEPIVSHDEMAAQDMEWNDLDRKIDAIENVLSLFSAE